MTYAVISDANAAYAFVTSYYDIGRTAQMRGLCQVRDGEIIAAVIYDDYNGQNVFCHIASDGSKRWMTRHFLHEIFKYPFRTLGCGRITLWIDATNIDSIKFVTNLGFRREAVLESAGKDAHDVLIYRMFRRECRYA
jgi:RimJ/RimL family protein N-acetyltransferase